MTGLMFQCRVTVHQAGVRRSCSMPSVNAQWL